MRWSWTIEFCPPGAVESREQWQSTALKKRPIVRPDGRSWDQGTEGRRVGIRKASERVVRKQASCPGMMTGQVRRASHPKATSTEEAVLQEGRECVSQP